MTQTTEIRCDACNADLTYTGNVVAYRLVLMSQNIGRYPGGGAVTAWHENDPLPRPLDFCRWRCAETWFEQRLASRDSQAKETQ